MRIPATLEGLVDHGVIQEVIRPLKSGKEAQVYLVECGGTEYIAKVYKEADDRTFRHRSDYTEGRVVRNTRDMRAIQRKTRYGRSQGESGWRTAEVEVIYRLQDAGVRVPVPYNFIDDVLIMELIKDADGNPAPRLGEVQLEPRDATDVFESLLKDVVQMLCAGVVHGDLSDFNVLMSAEGPVIIDFPQAIDAARNQNARKILLRDVENLNRFLSRSVPNRARRPFGEEMWELYKRGELRPDTQLTGKQGRGGKKADISGLMREIGHAKRDEQRRRETLGLHAIASTDAVVDESAETAEAAPAAGARRRRTEVVIQKPASRPARGGQGEGRGKGRPARGRGAGGGQGGRGRGEGPRAGDRRADAPKADRPREDAKPRRERADRPAGGPKRADRPEGRRERADRPASGPKRADRPEGRRERADRPESGPKRADRPEGRRERADRPEGRRERPARPEGESPRAPRPAGDAGSEGAPKKRRRRRRRKPAGAGAGPEVTPRPSEAGAPRPPREARSAPPRPDGARDDSAPRPKRRRRRRRGPSDAGTTS